MLFGVRRGFGAREGAGVSGDSRIGTGSACGGRGGECRVRVGRESAGVDGCRRKVQALIDGAICQGGERVIAVEGTLVVCGLAQGVA